MNMLLETKDYKEVEITLPFYAHYEGEMEDIFVKITDKDFKRITIYRSGGCEIFKCKTHNTLAAIWYENKCDSEQWEEAVRLAKNYVWFF